MRPRIESEAPGLVTPEALLRLVAIRTSHPRPIRPEVECMARTVYHEASNQALRGQLAVAQVILNRTKADAFPRTVCGVIGQPGQFSHAPMTASAATSKPWDTAVAISTIAEEDRLAQVAPGALFFHAAYARPAWSRTHERIAQIGDHIFYR
jgi:spore germination cell wall hydrolase CwlJ-like protein